jgi:membrane associated rhomboid family serine protease
MPAYWRQPVASKILFALKSTGPRLLLGLLGAWCVIGPFILLVSSGLAGGIITAVFFVLLLLGYAIVFMICYRWRWITLTELVSETGLALCFIIIGEVVGEMIGDFKIKGEMALIGAFTGFLIAELMKPKDPRKALDKMFSALFRKLLPYSR